MAGLRANQAALGIVSSNVANAQTPGYVSQRVNQIELAGGAGNGASVRVDGVNRQLDQYIQSQLRTETSGGAYADQIANILSQLQNVYGTPGQDGTLENAFSNFTSAVQSLSASSGSTSAQSQVLSAAQSLAQQLNATTTGIQTLRSNIEQDIGVSVGQANVALNQIAQLNSRLQSMNATDPAAATLMDQRDNAINQLSQLMDIRVVTDNTNQATVFTNSGIQLVGGGQASQLAFNSQGTLNANSQWNSNPALSGAGTITVKLPNGGNFDMIANNAIGSGQLAADLKLRDKTLVQAQAQVDQLAAALSSSLSDITKPGTGVTGPPAGFDLDLSGVQPGNSINLTYTDTATNTKHQVTILRVDDPAALPLQNTATADPNDKVIGVNFYRRHGVDRGAVEHRARRSASAILQSVRFDIARGRRQHQRGCRQRSVDDDNRFIACERQRATAAVHRRRRALHRQDHRRRFADDRACRTHHGQSGAIGRSVETHRLQYLAADAGGRYHARGFYLFAADVGQFHLPAADRTGLGHDAVQGHHLRLHAAIPQPAKQRVDDRDAAAAGTGCGGLHLAAEIQLDLGRQHRHRNGEPDRAAEFLRRECACDERGAEHDERRCCRFRAEVA